MNESVLRGSGGGRGSGDGRGSGSGGKTGDWKCSRGLCCEKELTEDDDEGDEETFIGEEDSCGGTPDEPRYIL